MFMVEGTGRLYLYPGGMPQEIYDSYTIIKTGLNRSYQRFYDSMYITLL